MLFADDFHQHPLFPPPVKFAVENLLPRAEMEFARRDRNHHLTAHDLPLQMRVGIVLIAVVAVLAGRGVGSQPLQPDFVVLMQAGLVVVDENRSGD